MKRRTFLASASAAAVCSLTPLPAIASVASAPTRLTIGRRVIEVNGRAADVYGLVQADGTSGLRLDAKDGFDVELSNTIAEPALIHWHGLTPPWAMDGVPNNPLAELKAAESRTYKFAVTAGGTHWMHAHTLQEQKLLAAPLIVRTAEDRSADEQEVVIMLHDFSFAEPEELLARLKGGAGDHAMQMDHSKMHGMTMDHSMDGSDMDMANMPMDGMDMGAMDLNDIDYDAYLANDRTLDDPEIVQVDKGGAVRLRIINGATSTGFTIDIGSLPGAAIAVDGQPIAPIAGSSFPMTMGQRLDVSLRIPPEGGVFPILALREGAPERTGIMLATKGASIGKLAAKADSKGPVLDLGFESSLSPLAGLSDRAANRRFDLRLTGSMQPYQWAIGGADKLDVAEGERVEIALRNMSMMAHPMHLHGHHFQVTGINGKALRGAMRDTVLVPPMQEVVIAFDAANTGNWPLHCHHLYHMASGMMAFVKYSKTG